MMAEMQRHERRSGRCSQQPEKCRRWGTPVVFCPDGAQERREEQRRDARVRDHGIGGEEVKGAHGDLTLDEEEPEWRHRRGDAAGGAAVCPKLVQCQ